MQNILLTNYIEDQFGFMPDCEHYTTIPGEYNFVETTFEGCPVLIVFLSGEEIPSLHGFSYGNEEQINAVSTFGCDTDYFNVVGDVFELNCNEGGLEIFIADPDALCEFYYNDNGYDVDAVAILVR